MSIKINKKKALDKWSPILKSLGVNESRYDWMSEMAEIHNIKESASLNEAYGAGTAYSNAANVAGMGGVVNPVIGALPGNTWGADSIAGSGDVGQNLLPVAMKIAAQTIGLDLVAVKPAAGPKIDLVFIDYKYDNVDMKLNERPQVIKLGAKDMTSTTYSNCITALKTAIKDNGFKESNDGIKGGRLFVNIAGTLSVTTTDPAKTNPVDVSGKMEFLGFSRIDRKPMFRVYRQPNTAGQQNYWQFDTKLNTFNATQSMAEQITIITNPEIELVSALEDHIPGFSSNWSANLHSGDYPMNRLEDDESYSGVIAPSMTSKSVPVGTVKIKTSLRRTQVEDIKANTGIDIVQKMESILVNELSQTISKQIVDRIGEMADMNRKNAPHLTYTGTNPTDWTIFDLDTNYITNMGAGAGETSYAAQRRLVTKIVKASNYIWNEGRLGPAEFIIVNGAVAATLTDVASYAVNPVNAKFNQQQQIYPLGTLNGMTVYVDPNKKFDDNDIIIGRKNGADQSGIVFIPYLMAQSISIISEATMAPTMELRSRYAITEVGFFPEKQYMRIRIEDTASILN